MRTKNKLKHYRQLSGLKQEDTAEVLGITTRQYGRIEKETPKSVIQFYRLAKHLNTTVDALLEQDSDTLPE